MDKAKVCPILQAGRMASSVGTRSSVGIQVCMGEDCEWFEHGCPAHPVTKEVRDKIRAMK